MISINFEVCNGCGSCVEICPTGALLLQNGKAGFDLSLCDGCEVCVDSCPLGAILPYEAQPVMSNVIHMPAESTRIANTPSEPRELKVRDTVLPAVGSLLVWMGQEIVPRLADLILKTWDKRVQVADSTVKYETMPPADQRPAVQGRQRRNRRRRKDRSNKFI